MLFNANKAVAVCSESICFSAARERESEPVSRNRSSEGPYHRSPANREICCSASEAVSAMEAGKIVRLLRDNTEPWSMELHSE